MRGTTTRTLPGGFHIPRGPPVASVRLRRRWWRIRSNGCFQPALTLRTSSPFRLSATFWRCITTKETAALPGAIAQRAIRAPCNHGQDFRVLNHDRCFGTGFEQRRDVSSPFAIPSTRDSQPLDPVAIGRFPIAQIGTRFRRGLVPIKVATC